MFCVMTLPYIFYGAEDAKSIVLDALSIAFLYSIDDVGGDLGGVDESRWNAPFVGTCKMFLDINRQRYQHDKGGGLLSDDDDEYGFQMAYPLDAEIPISQSLTQELKEWGEGSEPSDQVYELQWEITMRKDHNTAAWLFEQMDKNDQTSTLSDYGAYVIAFLTVWHSIMFLSLGKPVCGD
jgi:hypothetical protein